jgi:hypothetical protein
MEKPLERRQCKLFPITNKSTIAGSLLVNLEFVGARLKQTKGELPSKTLNGFIIVNRKLVSPTLPSSLSAHITVLWLIK